MRTDFIQENKETELIDRWMKQKERSLNGESEASERDGEREGGVSTDDREILIRKLNSGVSEENETDDHDGHAGEDGHRHSFAFRTITMSGGK